jgi:hypothetical protein
MKSVYSAVRTGYLNKAVCASSLKGKLKHVGEDITRKTVLLHFMLYCVLYRVVFTVINNLKALRPKYNIRLKISSELQTPAGQCCLGKYLLFVVNDI